jgi:hypothetical protein
MNGTLLTRVQAILRDHRSDQSNGDRAGAWSWGPELLLVMTTVLSLGVVVGAVSASTGAALLAAVTGLVLMPLLTEPRGAPADSHTV